MARLFTIAGDCQLVLHEGYIESGTGDLFHTIRTPALYSEARVIATLAVYEDAEEARLYPRHSINGTDWQGLQGELQPGGAQANSMRLAELANPRRPQYIEMSRYRVGATAVLAVFSLLHGFRTGVKYREQAANTWAGGAAAMSVATSPGTD